MLTIDGLRSLGADTQMGLSRCANNEALYLRLVGITLQDLSSGALGDALDAGDLDRAFSVAHKLKGGVNNLALTPIADPLCELTELLRRKTPGDYRALYEKMLRETKEFAAL